MTEKDSALLIDVNPVTVGYNVESVATVLSDKKLLQ